MSISLRLAVPPSAAAHAPTLRQPLNTRSGSNAIATAIGPVAFQPPRALRGAAPGASSWWRRRGDAALCCASAHVSAETMQWVSFAAAAILMLARGTTIQKSYLVPFIALQAPAEVISWIKADYGQWTAFIGLLLRLVYFIPGELELPLLTMLFVSIAPHRLASLRGTQDSVIVSLAIAAYLALQHFTAAGSVRKALDRGTVVATLSVICITLIPLFFLL
ncbi:cold-regulated 413 inner membrane protein 1, chloroplastic [Brachypodium distachyon]|uniref:Uncharacterized protein n=1 Tax=Brachypodium distachyon TaxID=15368 RepID=A0A2K2DE46_BRADI|nr:cold-regulated 413 inner membrane protein 1, chloroplastic [Brachypodium distachyon]PNT72540.1 hypothetical protein BRADI_2g45855v3 [Brachypodium distachyon]|eukprot:XP_003566964.3 cold-regulated 413 inner membrane protein 1, chloroplastic [Brachypodium distachyon]